MKRGQLELNEIIVVALGIAGFIIIAGLLGQWFSQAEGPMAEQICRGSVAAKVALGEDSALAENFPLLCNTQQLDLVPPAGKKLEEQKEYIKERFADMMVRCWDEFGQGTNTNLFKRTEFGTKECFICYAVSVKGLKEKDQFGAGKDDMVTAYELSQYLREKSHSAQIQGRTCYQGGGQCVKDKEKCPTKFPTLKGDCPDWDANGYKNKCCINTNSGCENKGGICASVTPQGGYKEYIDDLWDCPSGKRCYVTAKDYVSYMDYIQYSGGAGNVMLTDIKPAETYAIAVGIPSKSATTTFNAVLGVSAVGGSILLLTAAPVVGGVVGAAVDVVGLKAIALGGAYAGWKTNPGGKLYSIVDILSNKAQSTVYVMRLGTPDKSDPNSLQQYCHFNPGVGES